MIEDRVKGSIVLGTPNSKHNTGHFINPPGTGTLQPGVANKLDGGFGAAATDGIILAAACMEYLGQ